MSDLAIRYDLVVLHTGMTVSAVRARLSTIDVDADPIVLVRRQGIASITHHRVSRSRLEEALAGAPDDAVLSAIVDFDAANEVATFDVLQIDEDDLPYGALTLSHQVIAFSEGAMEMAMAGPRRGTRSIPRSDGPLEAAPPPAPEPQPTAAPPPESPRPEPGPAPPSDDTVTFAAFPNIEAPVTVEPDTEFEVAVSLQATAARHTGGSAVVVDELSPDDIADDTVELEIIVSGPFSLADGWENTGTLRVHRTTLEGDPFVVHLVPGDPPPTYDPQVGVWTARINVTFSYDGAFVGDAYREIRVNEMRSRSAGRESDRHPPGSGGSVATPDHGADLTIVIRDEADAAEGTFRIEMISPHLVAPVDVGRINLGNNTSGFAAGLVKAVDYTINDQVSDETLEGFGLILHDKMPDEFFTTLAKVWHATNGPDVDAGQRRIPDVLLLTDDWAVPWELLSVELDASRPGFLGAQVNLGRWPLEHADKLTAAPLELERLGVMVGFYADARGVAPLPRAEQEGTTLAASYDARAVNADDASFNQLLAGRFDDGFEFSGLHFAGHGESNPDKGTYLMYSNGKRMTYFPFRAARIAKEKAAFLFVNACQVGTADDILGSYGGLAGSAVAGGFKGFVAPLWSVADDVAQAISLGLYEASVAGKGVAEYLREVRERFAEDENAVAHTTYLAYTFYGHPRLRLGGPALKGDA